MAAALIAAAHPKDESLHAALWRAQSRLGNHEWHIEQGELRIQSESHRSQYWLTDGTRCECPSRKPTVCWHIAAWRILSVLAAVCGLEPDAQGQLVIVFPPDEDPSAY
jgi:hypothetical protein